MVIAAAAVVVEFTLSFAGAVYGTPSRSILGPASSLATSTGGTAAFSQLLKEDGYPVRQLQVPLRSTSLPLPGTLFVLDPQHSLTEELPVISRYLASGGASPRGQTRRGDFESSVGSGHAAGLAGIHAPAHRTGHPGAGEYAAETVVSDTAGSWKIPSPDQADGTGTLTILLSGPRGTLALLAEVGRGRLVLLASSSPLDNGLSLSRRQCGLRPRVAGPAGTPVAFDEYDHLQTSSGSGIAGLPGHWQAGLLLGLLAVVVWILSAARRFGPPARAQRALVPPRIAHVDAVANLLASGSPARLVAGAAPLRLAGRERLCRVLGTSQEASDAELAAKAATTTLPPGVVSAIVSEPRSETDLLALGPRLCRAQRKEKVVMTQGHHDGDGGAMATLRGRLNQQVEKVVVGQSHVVDATLAAIAVGGHLLFEGPPGSGQDARWPRRWPAPRPRDPAGPVHARHAALGRDRHVDPARNRARFPAGPDLHQPPAGRRDQPDASEDPGGPARGHAGGPGHGGRGRPALPQPFTVLATQNPIEYEGTYPLPEAQLDRFLMKLTVGYPPPDDEEALLRLRHSGVAPATLG